MSYKNLDSRVDSNKVYCYKSNEYSGDYRIEKNKTYEDVEYTLVANPVRSSDKEKKIIISLIAVIIVLSCILGITNSNKNKHLAQGSHDNSQVIEENITDETNAEDSEDNDVYKTIVESDKEIQANYIVNNENKMVNKKEGKLLENFKLKVNRKDTYSNVKALEYTKLNSNVSTYIT